MEPGGSFSEGSDRWFEHARNTCVDHLRALVSIKLARDAIDTLTRTYGKTTPIVAHALYIQSVISYTKPFSENRSKEKVIRYPLSKIKHAKGFDEELHRHLMLVRNKLVVHGDYGFFPSTMYVQCLGDERIPLSAGLNAKVLFGVSSVKFCERHASHISAVYSTIEQALTRDFSTLAGAAKTHAEAFEKTCNLPKVAGEFTATSTPEDFPKPFGPAATVEEPSFSDGLHEYSYLTMTHSAALVDEGPLKFHHDGEPREFIVTRTNAPQS